MDQGKSDITFLRAEGVSFFIQMMDVCFCDGCVFNFIRSGLIKKSLLIMLKTTPVLLG
jgi:hypothetical protein